MSFRPSALVPPTIMAQLRRTLWTPILINAAISFMPGVDALAHAGGALTGLVLGGSGLIVEGLPETAGSPARRRWTVAFALVVALMAASLGAAMGQGRPWELNGAPTLVPVDVDGTPFSMRVPLGLRATGCEKELDSTECGFGDLARDGAAVVLTLTPSEKTEVSESDLLELSGPGPVWSRRLGGARDGRRL